MSAAYLQTTRHPGSSLRYGRDDGRRSGRTGMMNFTNFRFETDADGIALADLGHARPLDERHHPRGDGRAVADRRDGRRATTAIKGCVITSGKEAFSGGADLTMLQGLGARLCAKLAKEKGEEEAMQRLLRGIAQAVAALSAARDLRQAVRGGDPRRLPRRRLRAGARLPLPRRVRRRRHPRRPARGQGRALPRRRRHAARGAADADRRRAADAVQGRADPPADGAQHGPRARGRAARRDRRRRRRPGSSGGGSAVAPWDQKGFKLPSGQGLFARRHA